MWLQVYIIREGQHRSIFQEHVGMVVWVPLLVRQQGIHNRKYLALFHDVDSENLIKDWRAHWECPMHPQKVSALDRCCSAFSVPKITILLSSPSLARTKFSPEAVLHHSPERSTSCVFQGAFLHSKRPARAQFQHLLTRLWETEGLTIIAL